MGAEEYFNKEKTLIEKCCSVVPNCVESLFKLYERIILSGKEQTSSPNKPQTPFMSGKYDDVFI